MILYFKFLGVNLKSQMQYKASFFMSSFAHFLITFVDFIGLWVLFSQFHSIKGWTLYEAMVFYGLVNTAFAFVEAFARGFDTFGEKIRTGEFDRMLLRPRSIILQIFGSEFQMMRVGRFFQGLVILILGIALTDVTLNIPKVLVLMGSFLGGIFLFLGLFMIQASISVWSIKSLEVMNAFTYGGVETGQYPLSAYMPWFRNIFIFIIPIALFNYFPLLYVFDKKELYPNLSFLYPYSWMGTIVFFFLAHKFFMFAVKKYQSTGS